MDRNSSGLIRQACKRQSPLLTFICNFLLEKAQQITIYICQVWQNLKNHSWAQWQSLICVINNRQLPLYGIIQPKISRSLINEEHCIARCGKSCFHRHLSVHRMRGSASEMGSVSEGGLHLRGCALGEGGCAL